MAFGDMKNSVGMALLRIRAISTNRYQTCTGARAGWKLYVLFIDFWWDGPLMK